MRGTARGGKVWEENCSSCCCIRMMGGVVQRQGVRGISWWLCIRQGSEGGRGRRMRG